MRIKLGFIIIFIFTGTLFLNAQQLPSSNQYLVNRYLLSPAFAGHNGNSQVFIGYKQDWSGFEGSPKTSILSGYIPITENAWLGSQIISDKADLFNNIYARFSYSYHLETGIDNKLLFSMWGSMFQNKISLSNAVIFDPNDPLLKDKQELTGFSLNAGASIVYKWREGYIGLTVPYLFQNKDIYSLSGTKNIVELNQQLIGHASYNFRIDYNWNIEPVLVYKWTKDFDSQIDLATIIYYRDDYWFSFMYRDIGKVGISVGANLADHFTLNYTYEFVTGQFVGNPSASHEFTLGFTIPQQENRTNWKKGYRYNRNR